MTSVADKLGIDAEGIRIYMLKCMINGASDYEEYIKPALEMYSYAHTGQKCATDITDSEFINAYGCIFGEYPKSVSSAINTLISTGLLCSDMCYDTKLLLMLSMGSSFWPEAKSRAVAPLTTMPKAATTIMVPPIGSAPCG